MTDKMMLSVSIGAAAFATYEAVWVGNQDRGLLLVLVSMVSLLIAAVDTLSARPPVRIVRARPRRLIPIERTVTVDGETYTLTDAGFVRVKRGERVGRVQRRRRG